MLDRQVAWFVTETAGDIVACNAVAERLFGRARREIIGCRLVALLTERSREPEADIRRRILAGEFVDPWPTACLDAAGQPRPIRLEGEALQDAAGVVTGIAWTARPQAPAPLESGAGRVNPLEDEFMIWLQREPRLSQFLKTDSLDGVWFRDLLSPTDVWVSPRLKAVLGYADDEAPNDVTWWRERVVADDLQGAMDNLRKHLADPNCPYDQEVRYRHRDGSIIWLRCRGLALRDETGRPVRMIGAHTNLTSNRLTGELRATQQRLRESEVRYRTVVEALPQLIWTGRPDGSLEFVNQNCLDYFGVRSLEELDEDWLERVHPEDRAALSRNWETARREGSAYSAEARLLRHDGVYRWFVARAYPTRDAEGRVERWYGFDTDVQDSHNAGVRLKEIEQRLRVAQAAGNEGLWEWDLKTGLLQWTPELERIYGLNPGEAEGTGDGWSRRVHPDDLAITMAKLWEAVENHRSFDVEFRIIHSAGHVVWVNGRGGASYDAEGKPVRLLGVNIDITRRKLAEAALRESEERVRQLEALGAQVGDVAHEFNNVVQAILGQADLIEETLGAGHPLAARIKAIDAAGRRAQEITRRLPHFGPSREHAGFADASVPGRAAAPVPGRAAPPPAQSLRVLYVDDEAALVELAAPMLAPYGFQVFGFTDPERALAAFRADPQGFEIVVTDVTMPRRTGLDLAREIIALRADLPIVLISGNLGPDAVTAARAAGIREIVAKPFTGVELARVLQKLSRS